MPQSCTAWFAKAINGFPLVKSDLSLARHCVVCSYYICSHAFESQKPLHCWTAMSADFQRIPRGAGKGKCDSCGALQACFLTRGDLYVSWEKGRDVFDRLLIDADPAINSGRFPSTFPVHRESIFGGGKIAM